MKGLTFQCRSPRTHGQCTRTLGTKHGKNSNLQVCLSKFVAFFTFLRRQHHPWAFLADMMGRRRCSRKEQTSVLFQNTLISSLYFFHYLPFQRPLNFIPTARSGCGLYSLVVVIERTCIATKSIGEYNLPARASFPTALHWGTSLTLGCATGWRYLPVVFFRLGSLTLLAFIIPFFLRKLKCILSKECGDSQLPL